MLRSLILEELPLAQRFVRAGEEVVPRFIVLAPDAQFMIIGPLPDETPARLERLQLIRGVMVSKAASGFVHASELREPDAIVEPRRVTVTTPGGLAEVLGPDYRDLADAPLDPALIESAFAEMRRFYR